MLCQERAPTVSLIVPLKHTIKRSMAPSAEDSPTVSLIMSAILSNLSDRYTAEHNYHNHNWSALQSTSDSELCLTLKTNARMFSTG